jgi:hypothetical protein
MDNINEEELNYIAERVLEKLIKSSQSPQWHQLNTPMTIGELLMGQLPFKETEEEMLLAEMARLTTLMNMYEEKQEYMKANIIQRKLERIRNRLDKLNNKNNGYDDKTDARPQI